MEILKTIINIFKKFLKLILILAVIGAVVWVAAYLWFENENKKEQELNLAFFTTEDYVSEKSKQIQWSIVESTYDNSQGKYQKAMDDGQLLFREVQRNSSPPYFALFYVSKNSEQFNFHVQILWVVDCNPDTTSEYKIGKNTLDLKCGKQGKYLYTTVRYLAQNESELRNTWIDINANGFKYSGSPNKFNMNELFQNKTLRNLESK